MPAAEKDVAVSQELAVSPALMERLSDARRQSDAIFSLVRSGSLYERPIPERHRIIFYIGHLEAFDWNLFNRALPGLKSAHPELDRLFAFGIDPVDGGLPADVPSDWPSLDAVHEYVRDVRNALDNSFGHSRGGASQALDGFSLHTLLNVAVEHRLMHAETLAYMLHQLPLHMKVTELEAPIQGGSAVAPRLVPIPPGSVTLGLDRNPDRNSDRNSEAFGWDNEYEAHSVEVPAFEIDEYKVTNQQYLEFVEAGGYEERTFWSEEDWNWKTAKGIAHPLFWKRDGQRWLWRGMFEEIPLPLNWPAYVSHAEATAYARWAGKSLPTEAEWQHAAYGTVEGHTRPYPWGSQAPNSKLGNFDFHRWDPMPVNAFPEAQSSFGVDDMLGNGWEWTSTAFGPFPGFEPFPFYRGYSADFFDGKHFVMKGGSARTAACMLRSTFRNWFQAHYQYVYAGFRCVVRQPLK